MAVPVCERVTGIEEVVATGIGSLGSSVKGCESVWTCKCALFLRSSPDGVSTIYEHDVSVVSDSCPEVCCPLVSIQTA